MQFTTLDAGHAVKAGVNCAVTFRGAWWFSACTESNLNGRYARGAAADDAHGVQWASLHGYSYSMQTSEMKIRPY